MTLMIERSLTLHDVGPAATTTASAALLQRAAATTPGGVNTARRKIDPPLCVRRGQGAYVMDLDGNVYVDYHAAYGAVFLGHSHPAVTARVEEAARNAVLFGVGTTEVEVEVAERLVRAVPSAEQAAFCNSGSEATLHALRLARAITGRDRLIKFQGLYHGFHDYVLRNVMSTPERIGRRDPMSAGMLPAAVDATLVCRYNDLDDTRATLEAHPGEVAAIVVEPVAHNSPSILPDEGFLTGLRELCDEHGALLIFDEVITGIRHHLGGYQAICGVMPDLTTVGKSLGNGYPVAAVLGRAEQLERFNTTATGDVTFAGTTNGSGVAMAAAAATLAELESGEPHEHVFALGERMRDGLRRIADDAGVPVVVSGYGSLYVMLFMEGPLHSYDDVQRNDHELFVAYRKELVRRGVFEMPENIGRNHISCAHTAEDVDRSLEIAAEALGAAVERTAAVHAG
jgi:glutamate-1-semialdehyde 2,1-aminomutase